MVWENIKVFLIFKTAIFYEIKPE